MKRSSNHEKSYHIFTKETRKETYKIRKSQLQSLNEEAKGMSYGGFGSFATS